MVEKSTQIDHSNQREITFNTKGFNRWGFWTNIAITVIGSMSIMSMLFAIQIPMIITTLLFMGSMFLILSMLSGKTKYTVNEMGVEQHIQPNLKKMKPIHRQFQWSNIKSYERGEDVNRGKQTYNFLYIDVDIAPGQLRLSDDKSDKNAFATFADKFEVFVSNVKGASEGAEPLIRSETTKHDITKKKSFYARPIAKIITIVFIVFCGFMIDFAIRNGLRNFNWYRLLVVVIPGTLYLIYRSFYQKK